MGGGPPEEEKANLMPAAKGRVEEVLEELQEEDCLVAKAWAEHDAQQPSDELPDSDDRVDG